MINIENIREERKFIEENKEELYELLKSSQKLLNNSSFFQELSQLLKEDYPEIREDQEKENDLNLDAILETYFGLCPETKRLTREYNIAYETYIEVLLSLSDAYDISLSETNLVLNGLDFVCVKKLRLTSNN